MKRSTFNISTSISFLLGIMSLLIVWQRLSVMRITRADRQSFRSSILPDSLFWPTSYEIQFPEVTPLKVGAAMAYHSNNPVFGLVASWPLWMANAQAILRLSLLVPLVAACFQLPVWLAQVSMLVAKNHRLTMQIRVLILRLLQATPLTNPQCLLKSKAHFLLQPVIHKQEQFLLELR